MSCGECSVIWVDEVGVDIKDYWYELNGILYCQHCQIDIKQKKK